MARHDSFGDAAFPTLHVVRDLTTTAGTAACSPEQYQQLRAFALDVGKDLRAQVLYQ